MNCSVEGCARERKSKRSDYCSLHYMRVWRYGRTSLREDVKPKLEPSGYVRVGSEREHRKVFKKAYAEIVPDCWGCGKPLSWDMGKAMHIDHINEDKSDNRIENLRASCWKCNVRRSAPGGSITLDARGRSMCVKDWSREPDVSFCYASILRRVKKGLSPEEALFGKKKTHFNQRECDLL